MADEYDSRTFHAVVLFIDALAFLYIVLSYIQDATTSSWANIGGAVIGILLSPLSFVVFIICMIDLMKKQAHPLTYISLLLVCITIHPGVSLSLAQKIADPYVPLSRADVAYDFQDIELYKDMCRDFKKEIWDIYAVRQNKIYFSPTERLTLYGTKEGKRLDKDVKEHLEKETTPDQKRIEYRFPAYEDYFQQPRFDKFRLLVFIDGQLLNLKIKSDKKTQAKMLKYQELYNKGIDWNDIQFAFFE